MKNKTRLILGLIIFILSCLYLLPFVDFYQAGDESILLAGAERIARGEVMYRDFYNFLGPGAFVFLAGLFKLFGVHILTARIAALLFGALIAVLTYLLAERLLKNPYLALLPAFIVLTAGFPNYFIYNHHWLSSLLSLLAVYLMVCGEAVTDIPLSQPFIKQVRRLYLYFGAGLFAALTLTCVQSKGLFLILALLGYLLLFSPHKPTKNYRPYLAGTFTGFGFLFFYLFLTGTLKSFFYYTWIWPFMHYASPNVVPYFHLGNDFLWESLTLQKKALMNPTFSSLLGFIFYSSESLFMVVVGYLSIIAIPVSFIWGWKIKRKDPSSREGFLLCLYALSSLAFWGSSWTRPDIVHLIFGASLPLILFFFLLQKGINASGIFQRGEKTQLSHQAAGLLLSMIVMLLGINTLTWTEDNLLKYFKRPRYTIESPRGRLWTSKKIDAQDYNILIPYLQVHLEPREPFFALYHQAIVYFFLGARNPTPVDHFNPEHSNKELLNNILETVKQKQVRYILKDNYVEDIKTGTFSYYYPHADFTAFIQEPFSRYLEENYQPVLVLNRLTLYQRKDS